MELLTMTNGDLIKTAREFGKEYFLQAISEYDCRREIDNYYDSEKSAWYFVQDRTFKLYSIKILIVLIYILKNNLNNTYEDYKKFINGKNTYLGIFQELVDDTDYYVIELTSEIRKEYLSYSKQYLVGYDKKRYVNMRVNQGPFRDLMLSRYQSCALCGMSLRDALIVSHIKAWHDSSPEEKTDINNALLLCPNHDKLFDRHLISFDENGQIMISKMLSKADCKLLNISKQNKLTVELNDRLLNYMEFHREKFINQSE